jgi:lysophospholipase L1-like esterase
MTSPTPAPPQPLRIVVLGDSLAAGTGDETGRGIGGHLASELAALGHGPVETRQLGARGATTGDLLARLAAQPTTRGAVSAADVIVLSIGANDLFRTPRAREEAMRAPLRVAESILGRVEGVVAELRRLNGGARILLLGAYNPAPGHTFAFLVERLVALWDARLRGRFAGDRRVAVVRIDDLLAHRERLSRLDGFHPGAEAYREVAARIAGMLAAELSSAA